MPNNKPVRLSKRRSL